MSYIGLWGDPTLSSSTKPECKLVYVGMRAHDRSNSIFRSLLCDMWGYCRSPCHHAHSDGDILPDVLAAKRQRTQDGSGDQPNFSA